jgi:hypothetical protein
MPVMRSCGHRNREGRPGVPLGWRRGRGGGGRGLPPPNLNPWMRRKKRRGGGELTPPPLSLLHETLLSFGDIISWQVGITVRVHQPTRTQTETGPSAGLPQHPCLALVSPNSRGVEHCACVDGTNSPTWDFIGPVVLINRYGCHGCDSGVVLVKSWGMEPSSKKAHFGAFLWASSWYMCGAAYC